MCGAVAVGVGLGLASLAGSLYGASVQRGIADKQMRAANAAAAEQQKAIEEAQAAQRAATPTAITTDTTETDRVKRLNRLRRGINQNIYSNNTVDGVGGNKGLGE